MNPNDLIPKTQALEHLLQQYKQAAEDHKTRSQCKKDIIKLLFELKAFPLNVLPDELLQDSSLKEIITNFQERFVLHSRQTGELKFWYAVQTESIENLEKKIIDWKMRYVEEAQSQGFGNPPIYFFSKTLIRNIYLSQNAELIALFQRHFPTPPAPFFNERVDVVERREKDCLQSIENLQKGAYKPSFDKITKSALVIQRRRRASLRKREELARISYLYGGSKSAVEKAIKDSNSLYQPTCEDSTLAHRIMNAAKKVRLFSTVKHWTSAQHTQAILDNCLYGRYNLYQHYQAFRKASLDEGDERQGDGNVICLGPFAIDYKAQKENSLVIEFDAEALARQNPTIFFKQRDFGFPHRKIHKIQICKDKKPILFSITDASSMMNYQAQDRRFTYLTIYEDHNLYGEDERPQKAISVRPNYSLISYNTDAIHAILTLNWFRFLDSKANEDMAPIREEVYSQLASLNDEELIDVLQSIGQKLSYTSEFNIYGAHQIDFASVKNVSFYQKRDQEKPTYKLNLDELITALNQNKLNKLNEAQKSIPNLFKSYRFLDYLIAQTTCNDAKIRLKTMRLHCETPAWVKNTPESLQLDKAQLTIEQQAAVTLQKVTKGHIARKAFKQSLAHQKATNGLKEIVQKKMVQSDIEALRVVAQRHNAGSKIARVSQSHRAWKAYTDTKPKLNKAYNELLKTLSGIHVLSKAQKKHIQNVALCLFKSPQNKNGQHDFQVIINQTQKAYYKAADKNKSWLKRLLDKLLRFFNLSQEANLKKSSHRFFKVAKNEKSDLIYTDKPLCKV